jgi:triosephosphate isomerase
MNLDYEGAQNYIKKIKDKISDKHEIIVLPSFIYLDMFKNSGYTLGAQNAHYLDKGAFTGEISPLQIKNLGVEYVLVGHSERRIHFKEDDKLINSKVKGCLKNNLKVILCIGETDEERRLRKTASVLQKQIVSNLNGVDEDALQDIVIAYEPVWAIGTGKTPSTEEIEDALIYISKTIKKHFRIEPRILYGGSVNKDNIKSIMRIKNIGGVLIGSSSIEPDYMLSMLDLVD